jgi:hypothetical protein
MEDAMRKLAISIAAAATLLTAAPALAQEFGVRIGHDYDYGRHYSWEHGRHLGWYRGDCRRVTVTERLPDGTRVTRTRDRC